MSDITHYKLNEGGTRWASPNSATTYGTTRRSQQQVGRNMQWPFMVGYRRYPAQYATLLRPTVLILIPLQLHKIRRTHPL